MRGRVGEASESLPIAFQGDPLEIGFNPEFLRAGLESIDDGDVLLKLISPGYLDQKNQLLKRLGNTPGR